MVAASPLRYRDFRVLWIASVLTGVGYVGETVVLGWLLLEETDSPFIVGLGVGLRALPNFLLGIPGGALADRVDRRALLRMLSLATAVNGMLLATLAFAGQLSVPLILLLTLSGGAIRALHQPARQSYAFDIVGPSQVVGGMAFMNLGQRVGGIAGSLGAGLILETSGAGAAYFVLATFALLSAIVLLLARSRGQAAPVSRPPVWQGLREFGVEVRRNRTLAILLFLTAAVEVLGFSHMAVMPSLARDLLDVGAGGLGLLSAFGSVGGIAAILLVSFWGELRHQGIVFLCVLLAFGSALVLLGSSNSIAMALAAITVVAGLAALSDLLTQSLIQSAVENDLRGRAMGSWVLAIGLGPVGHVQIGVLASFVGAAAALMTNGLLLVLLALIALVTAKQVRRL
jgi:MFS family permease